MKQIEEIFDFVRNGVSIKQTDGKGGIPITRIETIWNKSIDTNRFGYADISENDLEKYGKYLLQEGDILMTHINSPKHLGKCAMYKGEPNLLIHGMNLLCLRPNMETSLPNYLRYYFNSGYFKTQIPKIANQSVNQASFSAGKLQQLQIPLPPLKKQKKIASILDAAEAYRQKTKALIEKYDELTQSLFLEMFGDPVTNPKGWEVLTVRDIITEAKYGTSSKADEKGVYPYLRMNNITYQGYMDYTNLKYISTPDEQLHKYETKKGDVLFNRTNSKELVGKTGIISSDDKMILAGYLIRVRMKDGYNPYFLWAHLNSRWAKLTLQNMCKSIVGMANINAQELQNIIVLDTPENLQNQFAERVQQIENQKTQTQKSLEKAEDLFNSLLQKAFKGEVAA